ncbi:MAG TPA: hypothetical protein VGI83_02870 [Gemmatimonadales bacterium]|jgi:quercetin dioxygenase-like cupin family protein
MHPTRFVTIAVLITSPLAAQGRITSRTVLQATKTVTGQALEFPARGDKVIATVGTIKTKGQSGALTMRFPTSIHVLSGTVSLEITGKAPRAFKTGEAFVAPTRTAFTLANRGTVPTRFIAVAFAGEATPFAEQGAGARDFKADTVLETTTTWAGEPIIFPSGANQISVLMTSVPTAAVIAKHTHAHTQFVYMLEGEHTVEPAGHPRHSFSAGSAMIETTQPHVGTNAGHDVDRFVTVFAGKAGVPLSTLVH